MADTPKPLGQTRRGLPVMHPAHPSYHALERVRLLGADAAHLGKLAREAHPQYRAVDHEEASQMHYAARNMHAARAHEAASAAMSKSTTGPTTSVTGKPIAPAYDSTLTWVYQGADASLTPEQAAVAIQAATLGWAPQDHMDMGVVQHGLALALGDEPDKQALCAAAAFMHLSAAGAAPGVDLGKSLNAKLLRPKAGHKHAQIGTTRSGKPIFNAFNHPAHAGFTTADHVDHVEAMARHYKAGPKVAKSSGRLGPVRKGLEALADSDALRQMGQTVAAKHPTMTAADHLAASQNYARAGQPHLAIGHMIASTLKTPAAHQSVLSRAGA